MSNAGVSALVLTLNEAENIERCLSSLKWCKEVVVLDSCSTDRTTELAERHGARVVQRRFDDFATQRNYGLQCIPFESDWILMLDADEEVPSDLAAEMQEKVATADQAVCIFRWRRKDFLFGRALMRSVGYPTWSPRLVRRGGVTVERAVHEQMKTEGIVGNLICHLWHHPFNKGFSHWMQKHDLYSTVEARHQISGDDRNWTLGELFNVDATLRRSAQKRLVYSLPLRPIIVFLALYVLRGGFLEGRAGLICCVLRAFYEFMIDCKKLEYRRREEGKPI